MFNTYALMVVNIPLIAAGGIGCGKAMFAAMALGADGKNWKSFCS